MNEGGGAVIKPEEIGADEDIAREVLVLARGIAPCINSFADESEERKDAIAILRRVVKESITRGARGVKAQRVGPASVTYADIRAALDGDPTTALRQLCGMAPRADVPIGSFPTDRPIERIWPERY